MAHMMSIAALTEDGDDPRSAVQYAVQDGAAEARVYGDQSWVADGRAAEELGGRTVRRTVTVTYGQWEPVPPPLPPEPPNKSVVTAGGEVFQRDDDETGMVRWWKAGANISVDWRQVCEWGAPVRLVPAPEPVTVPWRSGPLKRVRDIGDVHRETHVWVGHGNEVRERIDRGSESGGGPQELIAVHTPESARAKAYALLSAADQAEGRVS